MKLLTPEERNKAEFKVECIGYLMGLMAIVMLLMVILEGAQ